MGGRGGREGREERLSVPEMKMKSENSITSMKKEIKLKMVIM